jgi:hypothetical protein
MNVGLAMRCCEGYEESEGLCSGKKMEKKKNSVSLKKSNYIYSNANLLPFFLLVKRTAAGPGSPGCWPASGSLHC